MSVCAKCGSTKLTERPCPKCGRWDNKPEAGTAEVDRPRGPRRSGGAAAKVKKLELEPA